jgi:alpha-galactosidase
VSSPAAAFDALSLSLRVGHMALGPIAPLVDGETPRVGAGRVASTEAGWNVTWPIEKGLAKRFVVRITPQSDAGVVHVEAVMEAVDAGARVDSIGLRFGAVAARRYLRNGYTSWDGSSFVDGAAPDGKAGHAVTALVSGGGDVTVLGFLRHDRFQSRFRFSTASDALSVDVETLVDRVAHDGTIRAESVALFAGQDVEATLRKWAQRVAAASELRPRAGPKRIQGWCSWYSLYASIGEPVILEHLQAAARFRDRYRVPFDVFQIDDGFVPEMGDWLDVKPQFPRGMAPLLADIRAAGFVPGLWIAPWMVGNRSRLYAEHPDWVVLERESGRPLAPMKFYGEFRWHKRSEEYYVLDVTRPEAEAHIRNVFRTWRRDWGCGYFKTDFMYFGTDQTPAQLGWHREGLSRMEIWMRMARLIREEIGDATWLGCGGPIWAPVGLVDAVRIGRDVGVQWKGHYSAESLLRDQVSRNFANGILWQADPDCILLRDRFHDLTDSEVQALMLFAGLSGGVLMTSDQLDEVPETRRALFAQLAQEAEVKPCDFPLLGLTDRDPVLVQRAHRGDGTTWVNVMNTGDETAERLVTWAVAGCARRGDVRALDPASSLVRTDEGVRLQLAPHTACRLAFAGTNQA